MKKGYTEIIAIIDKSGSMHPIKSDSIGGVNSFIESQKEQEGTANLTLVLFNTEVETIYESEDIKNIKGLNATSYIPNGMTAMNDAIGISINKLGLKLSKMKEEDRPENVIVAILTDGQENSSMEFSGEAVKSLIKEQTEKYNWEFIFLAANQNAVESGAGIGIPKERCMEYSADSKGMNNAYTSMSLASSLIRSGNRDFNINETT